MSAPTCPFSFLKILVTLLFSVHSYCRLSSVVRLKMPPGKRKKAKQALALQTITSKFSKKPSRKALLRVAEDRHAKKAELRKQANRMITSKEWAEPPPAHLNGRLDIPKMNTKHKTYFEIADNHEKKKKLEYKESSRIIRSSMLHLLIACLQVTNDHNPPPGFAFVPFGDPMVTNKCKELSRERDAMIFVVSVGRNKDGSWHKLSKYRIKKRRARRYPSMCIVLDITFVKLSWMKCARLSGRLSYRRLLSLLDSLSPFPRIRRTSMIKLTRHFVIFSPESQIQIDR